MTHPIAREISQLEKVAYAFMALVIVVGIIWAALDDTSFGAYYVPEDGVLEYFTAILLLATSILSVQRLVTQRSGKARMFAITTGFIALIMFFGAGEEVSWGQRIFGIQSGEFFESNNAQAETNLHNLRVNGVNINKMIFGKMLTLFLVLYYLVLPSVYLRGDWVRGLLDRLYIPVPKVHHGIAALVAGLSILLVASGKKGELNEVCLSVMFFVTVFGPMNALIYQRRDPAQAG